jgi:hypothetical protein
MAPAPYEEDHEETIFMNTYTIERNGNAMLGATKIITVEPSHKYPMCTILVVDRDMCSVFIHLIQITITY